MMMSGLFALVTAAMSLILAGRPRMAMGVFAVTLVFCVLVFRYHITDPLAISL